MNSLQLVLTAGLTGMLTAGCSIWHRPSDSATPPAPTAVASAAPTADDPPAGSSDSGWTSWHPGSETQIAYVSSSTGNDATARLYDPLEVGQDPFLPVADLQAFQTIEAAIAAISTSERARDLSSPDPTNPSDPDAAWRDNKNKRGKGDWILLQRGDEWVGEQFDQLPWGKSAEEPTLIASYGPSSARPVVKTGQKACLEFNSDGFQYIAFVGIHCYAHLRDPAASGFSWSAGEAGLEATVRADRPMDGLLIEDALFRYYSVNVLQRYNGDAVGPLRPSSDIVIRRNLFLDNYTIDGHSQGLFTKDMRDLLLEENIFDHNGWYQPQQVGGENRQSEGQATMFNHNTYFVNSRDVTFRENLFLRPSSMGNKWTANDGPASAGPIMIDNNLYVEGELGISMGGNQSGPLRFLQPTIINNVFMHIGRSHPTNRGLAWYIQVQDWDGGRLANNLLAHQQSPEATNVYGISIGSKDDEGLTRDLLVEGNILYDLRNIEGSNRAGMVLDADNAELVTIRANQIIFPDLDNVLIALQDGTASSFQLRDNLYQSSRNPARWFYLDSNAQSFEQWKAATGDASTLAAVAFPEPERTIESYYQSIGGSGSFEDFVAAVRQQSRANWQDNLTAAAINQYMREGFGQNKAP